MLNCEIIPFNVDVTKISNVLYVVGDKVIMYLGIFYELKKVIKNN